MRRAIGTERSVEETVMYAGHVLFREVNSSAKAQGRPTPPSSHLTVIRSVRLVPHGLSSPCQAVPIGLLVFDVITDSWSFTRCVRYQPFPRGFAAQTSEGSSRRGSLHWPYQPSRCKSLNLQRDKSRSEVFCISCLHLPNSAIPLVQQI